MRKTLIITGGAGFIGSNTAASFLKDGWHVVLLDNFSRKGTRENLDWLRSLKTQGILKVAEVDIRNGKKSPPYSISTGMPKSSCTSAAKWQ